MSLTVRGGGAPRRATMPVSRVAPLAPRRLGSNPSCCPWSHPHHCHTFSTLEKRSWSGLTGLPDNCTTATAGLVRTAVILCNLLSCNIA